MLLRHGVSASLLSSSMVRYCHVVSTPLMLLTAEAGDLLMMPCATALLSMALSFVKYSLAELGDNGCPFFPLRDSDIERCRRKPSTHFCVICAKVISP